MKYWPFLRSILRGFALAGWVLAAPLSPAHAQSVPIEELLSGVVHIKTFINPDGRTLQNLGRERQGTGVVIDNNGLILTIGYLMVEAHAAEITLNDGKTYAASIVGYDHETGFGLLQAISPLKVRAVALGRSADVKHLDRVIVAAFGGAGNSAPAFVLAKREFAGNWEYLLDEAIFTSPPHPAWSGAALLTREGKLVGIGSLIVGDATGQGDGIAGNMFVPIDRLGPILPDLIASGVAAGTPRPWLGVNADEVGGRLTVSRVTPEGPADKAGIRKGDVISGVKGEAPKGLADFYRKMWALGSAGVTVPLEIERAGGQQRFDVPSINRLEHLKLKTTF